MRNPETVLENLKAHANAAEYGYERLYRNLYNSSFYLLAYQQTYSKAGNMTAGVDNQTFDGMNLNRIQRIINSLKNHTYQPKPARRTYIPKKNKKLRPLGIPSSDDKLVQQVVKLMLESIYEDTFSDTSHGFRPNKSCITALSQVKINFTGVKWFVEGDIKSYFDMVDHHILISILRRRIKDEYFIGLIWKFLRAGYVENGILHIPDKGLHQGSLISPVLANIYLNEFDQYMDSYKTSFDKGIKRRRSPQYIRIQNKEYSLRKSIKELSASSTERKEKLITLKRLRNQRTSIPCSDPMDNSFKRIFYQRYADDFLIGIIGNKTDAENVKQNILEYLYDHLHLELSEEKTLITHGKDKAKFLGYEITIGKKGTPSKDKLGKLSDRHHGRVRLYIPQSAWLNKLKQSDSIYIRNSSGHQEKWVPRARNNLLYFPDHKIVAIYNQEITGLYQYYKIAHNASVLNKYYYMMKFSMIKTLAGKHQSSVRKIMRKYFHDGHFQIQYQSNDKIRTIQLYDSGFKKQPIFLNKAKPKNSRELTNRLLNNRCEWCGLEHQSVSSHQVRKLSELTGNNIWEDKMLQMNRKTLILCPNCHKLLHANLLS